MGTPAYNKTYLAEKDNLGAEGVYKLEESVECGVKHGVWKAKEGHYSYKSKFHWMVVKVEKVVPKVNADP